MICGTTYFSPRRGKQSWQLPPCSSSLLSHCKRANYQCAIWKRSLKASPQVPVLLAVYGAWKVMISPLTGEKGYLLLRQSWNFCHVIAKRNVFRTVVLVSRIIWSAPTCASWLLVCANQPPEDVDDTTDLHNDSDDSDDDDDNESNDCETQRLLLILIWINYEGSLLHPDW